VPVRDTGWPLVYVTTSSDILAQESDSPPTFRNTLDINAIHGISMLHCMTVWLAGGGTGLSSMWGRPLMTSTLIDARLAGVGIREIETAAFDDYFIAFK
jgi:hypothetical protein